MWMFRKGGEALETIVASVITGCITLAGVLIANGRAQAVMETKVEELTREVREHNNFARRMPVVEEQIKVINHRIEDLEGFHKPSGKGGNTLWQENMS
jgi:hypothetical protein